MCVWRLVCVEWRLVCVCVEAGVCVCGGWCVCVWRLVCVEWRLVCVCVEAGVCVCVEAGVWGVEVGVCRRERSTRVGSVTRVLIF